MRRPLRQHFSAFCDFPRAQGDNIFMVSRENVSWLTTNRNAIYFQKMDNNEEEIGYVISVLAKNYFRVTLVIWIIIWKMY